MKTPKRRVEILDTTLRDGTQGEGFTLSLEDKLAVAKRLDEIGVDVIEGGFPISNPKDEAFFKEIRSIKLKHAMVTCFGMTRRRGIKAEADTGLQALLASQTPAVTIVGKTSLYQARNVLSVSAEENLEMIADSVRLMRAAGRRVLYDAEHYFDGFVEDRGYALKALLAAKEAGADVLVLCDTNGGSTPEAVAEATQAACKAVGGRIGVHTHNDAAMAVACALAAVQAGAQHVQGTVNGVGERCGNMDWIALAANLTLKYSIDCLKPDSLRKLTSLSRFVYEIANINPVPGQAYVGPSAFTHKGGMHVHAVEKDSRTYEHVPPDSVGNTRKILVSELSGQSNIAATVGKRFGIENDRATLRRVLNRVQDLENQGYSFEAADGSFELLVRRELGKFSPRIKLDHYRAIVLRQGDSAAVSEATVKLEMDGSQQHCVAEGNGPVSAMEKALRKAISGACPKVRDLHLTDYKVRIVNSKDETNAVTRVVIEWRRTLPKGKSQAFGTIGVSANILDATWRALVDAYEYLLAVDEG